MRYLPEIIRVLDRFREPRVETLDGSFFRDRKREKAFQLYDGIRSGQFSNDSLAAEALYKTQSTDQRYTTLKGNLKRRLLNTLFHLNLRRVGFSESAQAGYALKKRAFLVHALVTLGARSAAMNLAKRNLELAQHYQVTDIAYEMCVLLRTHAALNTRLALYEHFDELVKKYLRLLREEEAAWECFDRVNMTMNRFTGGRRRFAERFTEYAEKLKTMLSEDSSFAFRMNYYRVLGAAHGASGKHRDRIATMDEACRYLDSVPHLAQRPRYGEFKLQQIDSLLRVGKITEAGILAEEAAEILKKYPGYIQRFSLDEYRLLILMNSLRFNEAIKLYFDVTSHYDFQSLPPSLLERWKIYEYYLHFALQKTGVAADSPFRHRFNVEALIDAVPASGRDKVGMNVALRILQILYLLEDGQFRAIFDRIESLTHYRTRYLVAKVTRASHLFFKLLRVMENTGYESKPARQQGQRYYMQLKTKEFDIVDSEQELQIVPFPWLWEQILDKLEDLERRDIRHGKPRAVGTSHAP